MKKLMMFAAAMTIVGGAYAQCADGCSLIYDFKASVQTTVAKVAKDDCGAICYRQCRKTQWKGYLISCGTCDCAAFKAAVLFVYNKKDKTDIIFDGAAAPAWNILNLVGKGQNTSKNQVEAMFTMAADTTSAIEGAFAGCGKAKDLVIQSINGNFVAQGPGPSCAANCEDPEAATIAIPLCPEEALDVGNAIYHGTWSIKYNKNLSKKGCGCGTAFDMFGGEEEI